MDSSRDHTLQMSFSGHGNVILPQAWFPAKETAKLQNREASTSVCLGGSFGPVTQKVSKWGGSNLQLGTLICIFVTNSHVEKSLDMLANDSGSWVCLYPQTCRQKGF